MASKPIRSDPDYYLDPLHSLGYLSWLSFRAFSRSLEKRTLKHGVTAGQWRFLRILWQEDGITQRELTQRIGMREPTTVTAVRSLESSGLIRRVRDRDDRRKMKVFLTPKAKRLQHKLMPYVADVLEIATQGISARDLATTQRVLAEMQQNLVRHDELDQVVKKPPAGSPRQR